MFTQSVVESGCELVVMILNEFLSALDFSTFISNLEVVTLTLFEILKYVYFFLPVPYLIPLLLLVFSVIGVKILVAMLRFVFEVWQTIMAPIGLL